MYKIKLNPKFFPDYNEETGKSETAENMIFIVGPTSMLVEKTQIPYNSGKYYKHNQAELERCHCRTGAAPVWATIKGMWFDNVEFDIVARSSIYADLIMNVNAGRIVVEDTDGREMSVGQLWDMVKQSGGGTSENCLLYEE